MACVTRLQAKKTDFSVRDSLLTPYLKAVRGRSQVIQESAGTPRSRRTLALDKHLHVMADSPPDRLHLNVTGPMDAPDVWSPSLIPAMAYTCLMMVLGILGNGLVCYVYGIRWQGTVTKVFIVFLAVLDLANCLLCMPTELAMLVHLVSFRAPYWCKVTRFFTYVLNGTSSLILVAIAFDRYYKICRPLSYFFTVRRAKATCLAAALFAVLVSWPSLVLYGDFTMSLGEAQLPDEVGVTCLISDAFIDSHWPLLYYCVYFSCYLVLVLAITVLYTLIARRIVSLRRAQKARQQARHFSHTPSNIESPLAAGVVCDGSRRCSQFSVPEVGRRASWDLLTADDLSQEKKIDILHKIDSPPAADTPWQRKDASFKKGSERKKARTSKKYLALPTLDFRQPSVRSRGGSRDDVRAEDDVRYADSSDAASVSAERSSATLPFEVNVDPSCQKAASSTQEVEVESPYDRQEAISAVVAASPRRMVSLKKPQMVSDRKDLDPEARGRHTESDLAEQGKSLLSANWQDKDKVRKESAVPDLSTIDCIPSANLADSTTPDISITPVATATTTRAYRNGDIGALPSVHPDTDERDWHEVTEYDVFQPLNVSTSKRQARKPSYDPAFLVPLTGYTGGHTPTSRLPSPCETPLRSGESPRVSTVAILEKLQKKLTYHPRKTTRMLFTISIVFVVSFLPFFVIVLIRSSMGRKFLDELIYTSVGVVSIFIRSSFISNAANPIIYGLCNRQFRSECNNVLRKLSGRRKQKAPPPVVRASDQQTDD